ncbi:MAG: Flp pilus assembly protein CpaB [Chloroflexota bacterium]
MGRRRSLLIFGFALVLGLAAAGLVYTYMQNMQAQARRATEEAKASVETTAVVVARQNIPVRTQITETMVEVKQIPVTAKLPQAPATTTDVLGKITRLPISAGEQVLPSKFGAQRGDSGLTYVIPPNKRAIAIAVSEVITSGGLILPGDIVDVIGVFDAKTMGKDMATYILQGIEVLAVAQTMPGDSVPQTATVDQAQQGVASVAGQKVATPVPTDQPKAQPAAKSVTLAVSPEEAQRLVLAETNGKLRLALRPARDATLVNLPEATLGTIRTPVQPDAAVIAAVNITPATMRAGDTLKVEVTVKNTSNAVIQSQGPNPEFVYVQGQTFYSQNFPSQDGRYRVAIGFDGSASAPLPYRWGLGADLPPGATTTVVGYIKMTHDVKASNFWAALVKEPSSVVQNNVGTTLVSVAPTNVAVIAVDVANVRSGPTIDASVIGKANYGTELPILGQEKDWYKVKLPDGKEGYVAAGWIVGASSQ